MVQLDNLICGIVESNMVANVSYTAFDITLKMQEKYKKNILHSDIKDKIHTISLNLMSAYDYTRTIIDIGTDINPFLYH